MTEEIKDETYFRLKEVYLSELQRLRERYDTLTNKFLNSETDKTRLKQENEKLKEERDFWCKKSGDFESFLDRITNKEDDYRKALEEIREIAEKELYLKQNSSLTKIIDKINEVLK